MTNTLIAQLNNPAVLQRYNQRLATVVSLMLVVACAYVLVEISWMFFPQAEDDMLLARKQTQPLLKNQLQDNSFGKLTASNIFGVSDEVAVIKQDKVPETKLNLTLKGVLAATPMNLASAIIAKGKAGKEDIYGIGDKMPGGVLVKEIHADHIVLERGGRLEILKLQKISGVSNLGSAAGRRNSSGYQYANTPAAALKEIRKNILKNPASFGDYALPVVVKENGKQIGYRLQPQNKGALLADLGLQPGDTITQINGIRLDKPQNGISALRKLSTARNLNIVVKRNGNEVPLNISLQ